MAEFNIINGELVPVIVPKTGLTHINGELYPVLGIESGAEEATPIGYVKYYNGSSNISLPIYNIADITNNGLRIYTGSVNACFELVATSDGNASAIHFYDGSTTLAVRQA